ncbi:hypothetical protein B0T09DRAFT_367759 [Sordaria sp. MPI-SDFR-AT-0083]|nr:hypothetical protein B0T09DRAFT_367759 [Sordaria sp. MPI-SDFR-AT-0083]
MVLTTSMRLFFGQLFLLCLTRAQNCSRNGLIKSVFEQNPGLRYVNQSDENMTLHTLDVPDEVPQVAMGALWSDNIDRLFLFGGQYFNSSAGAPSTVETVWSCIESTQSWENVVQNSPPFRLARGASVSIPETRKTYWMGGWADNSTTYEMRNRTYQQQLIEFDMETYNFSYYDAPGGFGNQKTGGGLVYLPYGKKGVLIAMGGSLCTSEDCHPVPGYHPLSQVTVFDLASERIYSQETTTGNGDPTTKGWWWPEGRADFCIVTVPSYDETVHAIYVWGGLVGPDGNSSDNLWVLSIPYGNSGRTLAVVDLTTVANGWWDGWVEHWQYLSGSQGYPAVTPWSRYNPRFAAYRLGTSLKRVAGNTPSNHTRPNPFRTKDYLTIARIAPPLLIALPFVLHMVQYLYSHIHFKKGGYKQVAPNATSMTWRPFVTRHPYLLFLALSSLALLVVVELLYQHSINPAFEPGQRTMHGYFVWNYLPVILAVLYGLLWQQCDAEIERIEPYYHLFTNKQRASNTVNVDYHTFWAPLRLWQANSLFSLEKRDGGTYGDLADFEDYGDDVGYSTRVAVMDWTFARAIEVMFGVNMMCAVALMIIFRQRESRMKTSGLYKDPRGMKWLRELTEGDKLMGATSFSDGTKPRCQLTPPGGLQDFVNDPDNLDEWARNHRCWTEERNGVLRLRPLIRELTSWWAMLQDFLDRTGLIVQQQPFTLNRLPVIGLLATVLTILGGTAWILHNHLKAIKSQDNSIPLPSDLYLVIAPGTSNPGTNTVSGASTSTHRDLEEYNTIPPLFIIYTAWKSGSHILVCLSFGTAASEFWALFLGTLQVSASNYGSTTWQVDLAGLLIVMVMEVVTVVGLVAVLWTGMSRQGKGKRRLAMKLATILQRMVLMTRVNTAITAGAGPGGVP